MNLSLKARRQLDVIHQSGEGLSRTLHDDRCIWSCDVPVDPSGRRGHFAGTEDHLMMFMHVTQKLHSAVVVDELPARSTWHVLPLHLCHALRTSL